MVVVTAVDFGKTLENCAVSEEKAFTVCGKKERMTDFFHKKNLLIF